MNKPFATTRFSMIAAAALAASSLAVVTAPTAIAAATQPAVQYNLATEAGRASLDARINRAARAACANKVEDGTNLRHRANPECVAAARAQIKREIAARTTPENLGG